MVYQQLSLPWECAGMFVRSRRISSVENVGGKAQRLELESDKVLSRHAACIS